MPVLAVERPEAGPQVLVLTEPAPQAAIDLAVHALQASAAVAGAVTTLRVEALAG